MACPHCAESVHKDAVICRFCDRGISELLYTPCPSCGEMIRRAAILCRYCRCEPLLKGLKDRESNLPKNPFYLTGKPATKPSRATQSPGNKKLMNLDDEAIDRLFKENLGVE